MRWLKITKRPNEVTAPAAASPLCLHPGGRRRGIGAFWRWNSDSERSRAMKWYICLVIASAMLSAGCGRNASSEIDFGTIKNSVYQNDYLGFSVAIPTNWCVQDQEAQRQILRRGLSVVAGDDKSLKATLRASELQSVYLFAAFKYPPGSPVTNNPAIMAVAENVRHLPGIQRGRDYLFHAKQLLQSGQVGVSFPGEVYTERLSGVDFDAMDVELSLGGRIAKEKYYATIRKGYALSLLFVCGPDGEEPFQKNVLNTVVFK
jgi:hypothetical protein